MPIYLEHGHNGPQERIEVLTVAKLLAVVRLATKFATEQIHAQDAAYVKNRHQANSEEHVTSSFINVIVIKLEICS